MCHYSNSIVDAAIFLSLATSIIFTARRVPATGEVQKIPLLMQSVLTGCIPLCEEILKKAVGATAQAQCQGAKLC